MRGMLVACGFLVVACAVPVARAQDHDDDAVGRAILETRISLSLEKATVRQVVEAIAEKTGMQYMAVDEALDMKRTVTIHITMRPVEEVLDFLEDHLHLDLDFGDLKETGVLMLGPREPEDEEDEGEDEKKEFVPLLEHTTVLGRIRNHPAIAGLLKRKPGVGFNLHYEADNRRWVADISLGGEEVGRVEVHEVDQVAARIVRVEIRDDLLGPAPRGPAPGPAENF